MSTESKPSVELAKGKYKDFNDYHLTEKLQEQEKIKLCRGRNAVFAMGPKALAISDEERRQLGKCIRSPKKFNFCPLEESREL